MLVGWGETFTHSSSFIILHVVCSTLAAVGVEIEIENKPLLSLLQWKKYPYNTPHLTSWVVVLSYTYQTCMCVWFSAKKIIAENVEEVNWMMMWNRMMCVHHRTILTKHVIYVAVIIPFFSGVCGICFGSLPFLPSSLPLFFPYNVLCYYIAVVFVCFSFFSVSYHIIMIFISYPFVFVCCVVACNHHHHQDDRRS